MKNLLKFQESLAKKYAYQRFPYDMRVKLRKIYLDNIPSDLSLDGSCDNLYTLNGELLSRGYSRIVIGDYGAFVEIPGEFINFGILKVKEGEEYRINNNQYNKNVKYRWYTSKGTNDIKIYFQMREVSYADYVPGMYYVSPYEVKLEL